MEDDRRPITGESDVAFDPGAKLNGCLEGGLAIFRKAPPVQPAMREAGRPGIEGVRP